MRRSLRGFTLVELLVATALLTFSLVVMLGFHAQAVRSNRNARKVTDCTFLAQGKLEELLALPWDATVGVPNQLQDGATSSASFSSDLYHSDNGAGSAPSEINAGWEATASAGMPPPTYRVTWDVETMNDSQTWIRVRVRCAYPDEAFNTWRGTTLSAYRYKDP